jgi:hypothetical protein
MQLQVNVPKQVKYPVQAGDILQMAGNLYIVMQHRRYDGESYSGLRYDMMSISGSGAWNSNLTEEKLQEELTSKHFTMHYPSAQYKLILEAK